MSKPQIPATGLSARRNGGVKPYIMAGALGVVAGIMSFAFAKLRR